MASLKVRVFFLFGGENDKEMNSNSTVGEEVKSHCDVVQVRLDVQRIETESALPVPIRRRLRERDSGFGLGAQIRRGKRAQQLVG